MMHDVATISSYSSWLMSFAQEVNLESVKERVLVSGLSQLMKTYLKKNNWIAASSNNIYWDLTPQPLRVISVPYGNKNITIVNPKIKTSGRKICSMEGCGGIPNKTYVIERYSELELTGNILEKKLKMETFKYQISDKLANEKILYMCLSTPPFIIQHELDHLDGKLICDKGKEFTLA